MQRTKQADDRCANCGRECVPAVDNYGEKYMGCPVCRIVLPPLERLAERGGLSACEAVAVAEDRRWQSMSDEAAVARLLEMVAEWRRKPGEPAKRAGGGG